MSICFARSTVELMRRCRFLSDGSDLIDAKLPDTDRGLENLLHRINFEYDTSRGSDSYVLYLALVGDILGTLADKGQLMAANKFCFYSSEAGVHIPAIQVDELADIETEVRKLYNDGYQVPELIVVANEFQRLDEERSSTIATVLDLQGAKFELQMANCLGLIEDGDLDDPELHYYNRYGRGLKESDLDERQSVIREKPRMLIYKSIKHVI